MSSVVYGCAQCVRKCAPHVGLPWLPPLPEYLVRTLPQHSMMLTETACTPLWVLQQDSLQ